MSGQDEAPPVVLVVEDERDLCDLYATWLDDAFEVDVAYSGTDALELVDDAVDVVLLDRRMPDKSGDEVLREIRRRGLGCRVVMVTAVEPAFDIVDMGFDDYLTKPVGPDDLRTAVDAVLARRQYDTEVQELFSLYATRRALGAEGAGEPSDRPAEQEPLDERIAALERELDGRMTEFTDEDFRAAFLTLSEVSTETEAEAGESG